MLEPESQPLTLDEVLAAKEQRAEVQAELRGLHHSSIISITVNIPGPVKYSADTVALLYYAMQEVRERLRTMDGALCEERILHQRTGPVAVLAVRGDAAALKQTSMAVEQATPFGRLLDIDIFDNHGRQINRERAGANSRRCFVCTRPAVECMREQAHSQKDIQAAVAELLRKFKAADTDRWPSAVSMIGETALEAMLMEVSCTPAPGLVDRDNPGAHRDMDFFTFLQSSSAISPAMYRCAFAGWRHEGIPAELLPVLRRIGLDAEKAMLQATQGVNTQKGLIFLLGIIAAAAALVLRHQPESFASADVLRSAAEICRGIVDRELASLRRRQIDRKFTAGERFYLEHGITGIRGEIETGLEIVLRTGLPLLRQALAAGLPVNDALVHALVGLMTEAQDTTILNRHDLATLAQVQATARAIIADGGMMAAKGRERIRELDELYSNHKNISPGGSADLLAVTYFLHALETKVHRLPARA